MSVQAFLLAACHKKQLTASVPGELELAMLTTLLVVSYGYIPISQSLVHEE